MRVNEFLHATAEETRRAVPPAWRHFRTRSRFTLIQLYFGRRTIHYEVWVRGKPHLLEIGLHCESDRATNAHLLEYFQQRELDIRAEFDGSVDVEQWTSSWVRVHQVMPYQSLDLPTAGRAGHALARMIAVLQPMLDKFPV